MQCTITLIVYKTFPIVNKILTMTNKYSKLTYLLTPWSRVLLEKLTSKLCC